MLNLLSHVRYAVRQFRGSPVFTAAAVLTLALGIGGTTAIFTLIDAVMLRSLPVSDPGSLYRVGEGDDCCVEGGPQDRWGMYSFPLYERLKAAAPEFEEVAAFQAGGARVSVRRAGVESGACVRAERRSAGCSAGGRAQSSCLAGCLWRRHVDTRLDSSSRGTSFHRHRSRATGLFCRNAT